jgi:hypothetical protein
MADIFVSYASPDREVAFRIVGFLEQNGISCWVAPRDVAPGVDYGQAIIDAIEQSRALVLILSDQSNDSQFVKKEVERAVSKTKPVLPVRIREVTPSGSLEFFISTAQWVDAWKSPMEQHLLPLVNAIKAIGNPGAAPVRSSTLPPAKRSNAPVIAGVAIAALIAGAAAWWFSSKSTAPTAQVASTPVTPAAPAASASAPPVATAPTAAPAPPAATPAPSAPIASAPQAPVSAGPKRSDVAFVLGTWCQPYQGMQIRYNVIGSGTDTVITQVDHPQSPSFETSARVMPIKGGFEFRPVDQAPDEKNIARFTIIDDKTLKLVLAEGQAQDGIVRVRCDPKK